MRDEKGFYCRGKIILFQLNNYVISESLCFSHVYQGSENVKLESKICG